MCGVPAREHQVECRVGAARYLKAKYAGRAHRETRYRSARRIAPVLAIDPNLARYLKGWPYTNVDDRHHELPSHRARNSIRIKTPRHNYRLTSIFHLLTHQTRLPPSSPRQRHRQQREGNGCNTGDIQIPAELERKQHERRLLVRTVRLLAECQRHRPASICGLSPVPVARLTRPTSPQNRALQTLCFAALCLHLLDTTRLRRRSAS